MDAAEAQLRNEIKELREYHSCRLENGDTLIITNAAALNSAIGSRVRKVLSMNGHHIVKERNAKVLLLTLELVDKEKESVNNEA